MQERQAGALPADARRPAVDAIPHVTTVPANSEKCSDRCLKRNKGQRPQTDMQIAASYIRLREEIPDHVTVVVAAKTRSIEEVMEVIDAGATDIGENYQGGDRRRVEHGPTRNRHLWAPRLQSSSSGAAKAG